MKPAVLIVEDSPSTAHLARLALADLPCDVELAPTVLWALALLHGSLLPRVMVVDAHLGGVSPEPFMHDLQQAAPGASFVILVDRGATTPKLPHFSYTCYKPLQPRRFASVVMELLDQQAPELEQ